METKVKKRASEVKKAQKLVQKALQAVVELEKCIQENPSTGLEASYYSSWLVLTPVRANLELFYQQLEKL